jgi:hypothetical protein
MYLLNSQRSQVATKGLPTVTHGEGPGVAVLDFGQPLRGPSSYAGPGARGRGEGPSRAAAAAASAALGWCGVVFNRSARYSNSCDHQNSLETKNYIFVTLRILV